MCLVALAIGMHPNYPVVIVANRDEFHARASRPLAPWNEYADLVGGRDLQAGGGWMAASRSGRVALVTNIRRPGTPPGLSRGHLVRDCLLDDSPVTDSIERLRSVATDYSPFNLIAGQGNELGFINSDGTLVRKLDAGIYTLSNATLDTPWPKTERLRLALRAWCDRAEIDESPLFEALADTTEAADADLPNTGVGLATERLLSAPFIVGDRYGTRSSTLYRLGMQGQASMQERCFGPNGVRIGAHRVDWVVA